MPKPFPYMYIRYRYRRFKIKLKLFIKYKSTFPGKFMLPVLSYKQAKHLVKLYKGGKEETT